MTLRAAIGKVVRTDDRGGCVAERDGVDNKAWDKKEEGGRRGRGWKEGKVDGFMKKGVRKGGKGEGDE